MTKDPAFLFYPGDWQLGTMHLTLLEKGCYIELLVLQFAKGKFTEAQAKHMLNGSFDLAWATLREKFETDGTFFWNRRLQLEKEKRQRFTDSRKSNGSVKKEVKHMPKHMEDENINVNEGTSVSVLKVAQGEKWEDIHGKTWEEVKNKWFEDFRWREKICMDFSIPIIQVDKLTQEFIKDLELKDDYKDVPGLKRHFVNWYKKHHNGGKINGGTSANNGTGSKKLGTSDARTEALKNW